jgi:hypothetical protein
VTKDKIPTREQRQETGKSLREKCPRGSHGEIILGQGEKRDIITLIEESNSHPPWTDAPVGVCVVNPNGLAAVLR